MASNHDFKTTGNRTNLSQVELFLPSLDIGIMWLEKVAKNGISVSFKKQKTTERR